MRDRTNRDNPPPLKRTQNLIPIPPERLGSNAVAAALATADKISRKNKKHRIYGGKTFVETPSNESGGTFDNGGIGQQVTIQQPTQRELTNKLSEFERHFEEAKQLNSALRSCVEMRKGFLEDLKKSHMFLVPTKSSDSSMTVDLVKRRITVEVPRTEIWLSLDRTLNGLKADIDSMERRIRKREWGGRRDKGSCRRFIIFLPLFSHSSQLHLSLLDQSNPVSTSSLHKTPNQHGKRPQTCTIG